MKVIFRAIGGFFARIWRWIKETAWVQPLLIVSLIFGVILLIQPISEGVVALGDAITNNERYYNQNKLSVYGDKAYNYVYNADERFSENDKYFLMFVSKDCEHCKTTYQGVKTLIEDNTFTGDYKFKVIYVDEQTKVDPKTDEDSYLYKLFYSNKMEVAEFREQVAKVAKDSNYYEIGIDYDSNYEEELSDIEEGKDLYTPLVILMDKETYDEDNSTYGIKDAMIGVRGWDESSPDNKYEIAKTFDHIWNQEYDN